MIRCRLNEIAESKGLNQSKLVDLTGISPNTIQSYFYDTVIRPDVKIVEILCKKLNVRFTDLFVREEDRDTPKFFKDDPSRRHLAYAEPQATNQ